MPDPDLRSGECLLDAPDEDQSTIMTSNRPLEGWGKLLSDVPTAGANIAKIPPAETYDATHQNVWKPRLRDG